ncbi:MAG: hypothetical protein QNJ31_05040 [Candidatus Caenarcaniphilales bacterium]|nr:hypothetical protein [Candidatus Caenarcaniphilales bacterium]
MNSEQPLEAKPTELSKEALLVLKQTIKEIKNNIVSTKAIGKDLLIMNTLDIASSLNGKIDSAQFTNPSDFE